MGGDSVPDAWGTSWEMDIPACVPSGQDLMAAACKAGADACTLSCKPGGITTWQEPQAMCMDDAVVPMCGNPTPPQQHQQRLRSDMSSDGGASSPVLLHGSNSSASMDMFGSSEDGGDTDCISPMASPRSLTLGGDDSSPALGSRGQAAAPQLPQSLLAERSALDLAVTAMWDDCDARGLFRYNVATDIETRVVPGPWGWVAQLNEGRTSKKRATELCVNTVLQPFDHGKFHFGKAFLREVLLQFELGRAGEGGAAADKMAGRSFLVNDSGARMYESSRMTQDPTLIMINVSPIDYGHVLLVPRVLALQPQQLEHHGVSAALALVREIANPAFRLGYNSLGAFATINHLHFQGYYQNNVLPCERARTTPVPGFAHRSVTLSRLVDYPVRGWVVGAAEGVAPAAAEAEMAATVMRVCDVLQAADQPFNVFIVEQGARVFIWPQCYAQRQVAGEVPADLLDTGVNPAVFEVAGHLVLKRAEDFHGATDAWAQRLLAAVSLTSTDCGQLEQLFLAEEVAVETAVAVILA